MVGASKGLARPKRCVCMDTGSVSWPLLPTGPQASPCSTLGDLVARQEGAASWSAVGWGTGLGQLLGGQELRVHEGSFASELGEAPARAHVGSERTCVGVLVASHLRASVNPEVESVGFGPIVGTEPLRKCLKGRKEQKLESTNPAGRPKDLQEDPSHTSLKRQGHQDTCVVSSELSPGQQSGPSPWASLAQQDPPSSLG